jgi:hypothetical protein
VTRLHHLLTLQQVARQDADILLSAGKYFLKHDFSEPATRSPGDSQRNVSRSPPEGSSVAAGTRARNSSRPADHYENHANALVLTLNKMNV